MEADMCTHHESPGVAWLKEGFKGLTCARSGARGVMVNASINVGTGAGAAVSSGGYRASERALSIWMCVGGGRRQTLKARMIRND